MKKEFTILKKSGEKYMGVFGGRKGEGKRGREGGCHLT